MMTTKRRSKKKEASQQRRRSTADRGSLRCRVDAAGSAAGAAAAASQELKHTACRWTPRGGDAWRFNWCEKRTKMRERTRNSEKKESKNRSIFFFTLSRPPSLVFPTFFKSNSPSPPPPRPPYLWEGE